MTDNDFAWAAELMERRRDRYVHYSPVFWRPAPNSADAHARFLSSLGARERVITLRTAHGFVIASPQGGRCFVDDFAVEDDRFWATEGRDLLVGAWRAARGSDCAALRVVTARRDEPKRQMLIGLGLTPNARWWVKELSPTASAGPYGPVRIGDFEAQLVPAPPVYSPGGPVCLLGDLDPEKARSAAEQAAAAGAVLAIVQRDGGESPVRASEPALEAAGYHNPAEFYQGML